ncbi:MAG: penicillin-binding protein 2 [Xanthomonadales bacterium]|jgi:cell division protein FtsI (penicillin-binding protein 3)|nr:penicillin-binding protein 2 [Xanthomonadales bacterium]
MSQARPRPRPVSTTGRLQAVLAVLMLSLLVVCARALDLQVVRPQYYQEKGKDKSVTAVPLPTQRGSVYDANGEVLAVSTQAISIVVDPKQLLAQPERIPGVAGALQLDPQGFGQELRARAHLRHWIPPGLSRMRPDDAEVRLAALPPLQKKQVRDVYRELDWHRWFPAGEAAAHLTGFINSKGVGVEGLERQRELHLAGSPGLKRVLRDAHGGVLADLDLIEPVRYGLDLQLSIDLRIQFLAYRALQEAVRHHAGQQESPNPTTGSMVILDIPTGQVLAMVNYPSFNPNASIDRGEARLNQAVSDLLEPGSTIKPFTIAAALLSGKFQPDTVIPIGGKRVVINRHTVTDVKASDQLTVTGVLARSSNIGSSRMMIELQPENVHSLFRSFGFGERTGTEFANESAGKLPPVNEWRGPLPVTLSYGYGMQATVLQLAQAYAVFGDHGRFRPVSLYKGMVHEARAIIDPELAQAVLGMLEAAVLPPMGTGTAAQIPNYRVAGKTGTTKLSEGRRGYASGRYASLFAGIVPVNAPRLVGVVVINDPKGRDYYGGAVAAPVFAKVMEGALRLLNVPPDNLGGRGLDFAALNAEQRRELAAEGFGDEAELR